MQSKSILLLGKMHAWTLSIACHSDFMKNRRIVLDLSDKLEEDADIKELLLGRD